MIGIWGAEAVRLWGVAVGGGLRVREAQKMYKVQDGSGITYLLYQCNSSCNNTVNLLQI